MGEFCTGEICAFDTIQMMLAERKKYYMLHEEWIKGYGMLLSEQKAKFGAIAIQNIYPEDGMSLSTVIGRQYGFRSTWAKHT